MHLEPVPSRLPGDAVHGHRPRQADEDGEVVGGQGAVPRLSDAPRPQGGKNRKKIFPKTLVILGGGRGFCVCVRS